MRASSCIGLDTIMELEYSINVRHDFLNEGERIDFQEDAQEFMAVWKQMVS